MDRFTLTARWTLLPQGPPLDGARVTIVEGRIAGVNDSSISTGPIQDLGDVVLAPGLINAHTHLEFSDLVKPLGTPATPLPDWIRLVIGNRKCSTRDRYNNVLRGLRSCLRHGVTYVADIATASFTQLDSLPPVRAFQEVIGFSAARTHSALEEVLNRVEASNTPGLSPHAPYTVHPQLLGSLVEQAGRRKLPPGNALGRITGRAAIAQQKCGTSS